MYGELLPEFGHLEFTESLGRLPAALNMMIRDHVYICYKHDYTLQFNYQSVGANARVIVLLLLAPGRSRLPGLFQLTLQGLHR